MVGRSEGMRSREVAGALALVLSLGALACARRPAAGVVAPDSEPLATDAEPASARPSRASEGPAPQDPAEPLAQPLTLDAAEQALRDGRFEEALEVCDEIRDELEPDDADHQRATECIILAHAGARDYEAAQEQMDCYGFEEDEEVVQCTIAYAELLERGGHVAIAANTLTVIAETMGAAPPELRDLESRLVAALDARGRAVAEEATGGSYTEALKASPEQFAQELVAQLGDAPRDTLAPLVHPDWGLLVVTTPAHLDELTRVTTFPLADEMMVPEGAIMAVIAKATRLPRRYRERHDETGCTWPADAVTNASGSAIDGWTAQFGSAFWAAPDIPWTAEPAVGVTMVGGDEAWVRAVGRNVLASTHSVYASGMRVDFGKIDGRWYALAVDASDDFCG